MSSKMEEGIAIKVEGIGKCYRSYPDALSHLKQAILSKRHYFQEKWVLNNITFELERGKALGIVGKNGAGKSTLLQIMSGTLTPTIGRVHMRGTIAALLELGSGFNPEFTGRENVFVNGSILGLSRRKIIEKFDDIVKFSELEDVIDRPVKIYSSGMFIRLAFAIQTCIDPDILIVDEALAVGDVFFQQKCHRRMEKLLERGTSILLVSHDTSAIRKYCDKVLFLEHGNNIYYGDVEVALSKYLFRSNSARTAQSNDAHVVTEPDVQSKIQKEDCLQKAELIHSKWVLPWPDNNQFLDIEGKEIVGSKEDARIVRLAICGADGRKSDSFEQGQWAYFFWEVELLRDFQAPIGGLTITSVSNLALYCRSTAQAEEDFPINQKKGTVLRFQNAVKLDLAFGAYSFTVALGEMNSSDYLRRKNVSAHDFASSSKKVISLPTSGSFHVIESKLDLKYRFYGLVDLPNKYYVFVNK